MKDYIRVDDRMRNLDEIEYIRKTVGRRVERQMNFLIAFTLVVGIIGLLFA